MTMRDLSRALLLAACLGTLAFPGFAQTTDLRGWEETPGLFGYLIQPESAWRAGVPTLEYRPVRDRVSGTSALALTFRGEGEPATFVYRPPGAVFAGRAGWAGMSLWVKGDGSAGVGVVGVGEGGPNDPRATFYLRQKSWQPLRLRWEDFRPPVTSTVVDAVFFSVTPGTKRPATFLVDKLELVRGIGPVRDDDAVRAAGDKAATEPEVPRPEDLSKFATGRERLAGARARLDAKKGVRVLVVGDAVAQGAALWNVPPGARPDALFHGRLRAALRAMGPESAVASMPVEGPETAVAQLPAALRAFRPDVVVIELSCSAPGVRVGAAARARDAVKTLFEICRNAGVEALVLAIPPLPDAFRRVDYAALLADEAARASVPAIDFGAFAAARGRGFEGEYYAAPDALNVQGHAAAARLIESVLVNP